MYVFDVKLIEFFSLFVQLFSGSFVAHLIIVIIIVVSVVLRVFQENIEDPYKL